MGTPVHDRVASADVAGGYIRASGVARMRKMFANQESASRFYEWASSPIGKLVVCALRDMALNGTPGGTPDSIGVQYGMTLGLNMAASLIEDPSTVYPELFANATAVEIPAQDYDVSPAQALDGLGN